jgi:hypothetical protein
MGSCGCDPGQRSVVDVVTKYNDGVPKGVAVQQTVTWTPNQVPKLIGHHATEPLWWPARSAAETVAGQIFSVEYDGIRRVTGMLAGVACGATPVTILDGGRSNTAAVMAIGWTACISLPGRLETDEIRVSEVQSQLSMPPTRAVNNSGVAKQQVLCQWTRGH